MERKEKQVGITTGARVFTPDIVQKEMQITNKVNLKVQNETPDPELPRNIKNALLKG